MERRNPFISNLFRILYYFLIIFIPLVMSVASSLVSRYFIQHNIFNVGRYLDIKFLESILEIFGFMFFFMLILVCVYIWSQKKLHLIIKKIELSCKHISNEEGYIPMKFRKADTFFSFGGSFNEFIDKYMKRRNRANHVLHSLSQKLYHISDEPNESELKELKIVCDHI